MGSRIRLQIRKEVAEKVLASVAAEAISTVGEFDYAFVGAPSRLTLGQPTVTLDGLNASQLGSSSKTLTKSGLRLTTEVPFANSALLAPFGHADVGVIAGGVDLVVAQHPGVAIPSAEDLQLTVLPLSLNKTYLDVFVGGDYARRVTLAEVLCPEQASLKDFVNEALSFAKRLVLGASRTQSLAAIKLQLNALRQAILSEPTQPQKALQLVMDVRQFLQSLADSSAVAKIADIYSATSIAGGCASAGGLAAISELLQSEVLNPLIDEKQFIIDKKIKAAVIGPMRKQLLEFGELAGKASSITAGTITPAWSFALGVIGAGTGSCIEAVVDVSYKFDYGDPSPSNNGAKGNRKIAEPLVDTKSPSLSPTISRLGEGGNRVQEGDAFLEEWKQEQLSALPTAYSKESLHVAEPYAFGQSSENTGTVIGQWQQKLATQVVKDLNARLESDSHIASVSDACMLGKWDAALSVDAGLISSLLSYPLIARTIGSSYSIPSVNVSISSGTIRIGVNVYEGQFHTGVFTISSPLLEIDARLSLIESSGKKMPGVAAKVLGINIRANIAGSSISLVKNSKVDHKILLGYLDALMPSFAMLLVQKYTGKATIGELTKMAEALVVQLYLDFEKAVDEALSKFATEPVSFPIGVQTEISLLTREVGLSDGHIIARGDLKIKTLDIGPPDIASVLAVRSTPMVAWSQQSSWVGAAEEDKSFFQSPSPDNPWVADVRKVACGTFDYPVLARLPQPPFLGANIVLPAPLANAFSVGADAAIRPVNYKLTGSRSSTKMVSGAVSTIQLGRPNVSVTGFLQSPEDTEVVDKSFSVRSASVSPMIQSSLTALVSDVKSGSKSCESALATAHAALGSVWLATNGTREFVGNSEVNLSVYWWQDLSDTLGVLAVSYSALDAFATDYHDKSLVGFNAFDYRAAMLEFIGSSTVQLLNFARTAPTIDGVMHFGLDFSIGVVDWSGIELSLPTVPGQKMNSKPDGWGIPGQGLAPIAASARNGEAFAIAQAEYWNGMRPNYDRVRPRIWRGLSTRPIRHDLDLQDSAARRLVIIGEERSLGGRRRGSPWSTTAAPIDGAGRDE